MIVIEPDTFDAGEDISHATKGVTLSTVITDLSFGDTYVGPVYAGYGIELAPTGKKVFSPYEDPTLPAAFDYLGSDPNLRIDFNLSVQAIEFLWMDEEVALLPDGDLLTGDLLALFAFDAYDNLLGDCYLGESGCFVDFRGFLGDPVVASDGWVFGDGAFSTTFNFTGLGDVAYVLAGHVVTDRVRITVPEPGSLALLSFGLAGLSLVRRRRKL